MRREASGATDPRILIPRAELCNPLPNSDLVASRLGRCTYRCTGVQVNKQLAEFIAAWPSLPERHREAISMLARPTGPPELK